MKLLGIRVPTLFYSKVQSYLQGYFLPPLQSIEMCHCLLSSIVQIILAVVFLVHFTTQSPIHRRSTATQDFVDESYEDQIEICKNGSRTNCISLKEVIVETYNVGNGEPLYEVTPYHIFSVFDLFYSGLITGKDAPRANSRVQTPESTNIKKMYKNRCEMLIGKINLSKKDTEFCQWTYSCKYNPNYFPSFTVQAKLDASSDAGRCTSHTISTVKFIRTECLANSQEDHWCKCGVDSIVTGYKHDHQSRVSS